LKQKKRCSVNMEIFPYLRDHHVEGKAVLPAVEALIVMARAARQAYPEIHLSKLSRAAFTRFLYLEPGKKYQTVYVDLEPAEDGSLVTSLFTSLTSRTGKISRDILHAQVTFSGGGSERVGTSPWNAIEKLKGECISVPAATIYRELVPFHEAYQNILGDLSVSSQGALAYISGGDREADDELLGSPFPLDATMHAACIWGQRFAGIVSFPVGFEERRIYQKTKKGKEYLGRVVPIKVTQDCLIFDAWIYRQEVICEKISGIVMKDVTRGRLRPPAWIRLESKT